MSRYTLLHKICHSHLHPATVLYMNRLSVSDQLDVDLIMAWHLSAFG